MESKNHINRVAILFDVENINPEEILPHSIQALEQAGYQVFPRKVIFNNVTQLKKSFLGPAIKSYHLDLVCSYAATGKNIADFRLYIEALDLLYTHPEINGFCIVSGDADFAELVIKLHHENKFVIGIGPLSKSKPEYVNLFDKFLYIEDLCKKDEAPKAKNTKTESKNITKKSNKTEVKKEIKANKKTEVNNDTKNIKKKNTKKNIQKDISSVEEERIIRTESDKNESYYQELRECISHICKEYYTKGTKEIFYSNLVKEIKDRSYYLESFTRITFDDIEKCGYHLIRKEEEKPETSYINTNSLSEINA